MYHCDGKIINCIIIGNSATGTPASAGGGIFNNSANPTISRCLIIGNSAYSGGGICNMDSAYLELDNCLFANNYGSGIETYSTTYATCTTLVNCILVNNYGPFQDLSSTD